MAAVVSKNELTASKRRCDLIVYADGGTPAPRATDFIALAIIYVCGTQSPHYAAAAGTCTNKRKPLSFTSFTFTADSATDKLTKVAHGLNTGDGPINVSNSGGGLPAPLVAATNYWVIRVDADNFYLATTLANAYANTRIDITSNGTGTQTLAAIGGTQQGIDGRFTYEFTQAETNADLSELSVLVEGTGYSLANGGGTYTTVNVAQPAADIWNYVLENSQSAGSLLRGVARTMMAKFSKSGTLYQFRDLADSKNSHHGDVTALGRTTSVIDDLT